MAPEFTELDGVASPGWLLDCDFVGDGRVEEVTVAPPTRFCSKEDKVGSANPAPGIVEVAPPVALGNSRSLLVAYYTESRIQENSLSAYLVIND